MLRQDVAVDLSHQHPAHVFLRKLAIEACSFLSSLRTQFLKKKNTKTLRWFYRKNGGKEGVWKRVSVG